MKAVFRSLLFVCLLLPLGLLGLARQKAGNNNELVGKWQGVVKAGEQEMGITLELKTEKNKLVGQLHTGHGIWTITDVKFAAGKWVIAWVTPEGGAGKMIGTHKETKLAGDWDNSPAFVGTFALTKK